MINKQTTNGDKKMTTTVTYNTIKNMAVEVKNPLSDRVIHVVGAFITGFAEAWVKYATNNAMVSDDVLCSSIGASNVREALKIGLLERLTDRGYEAGGEVFDLAVEQLDDDMAWNMEIYKARGLSHDDAWKKAVSDFYPEMKLA
jgi:hypothetical protein